MANTGDRDGTAVVQLYIAPPQNGQTPRPARALKGFSKLALAPGEMRDIALHLNPRDFAYWDTDGGNWHVAAGTYGLQFGLSVNDIHTEIPITLDETRLNP